MAYEVKDWKKPNCSLSLKVEQFSNREEYSEEINNKYGEGGGLNANYRTVEAISIISNILGLAGLKYGKDFVFKTGGGDEISFDFRDEIVMIKAKQFIVGYKITLLITR